jgi:hypothetical protein
VILRAKHKAKARDTALTAYWNTGDRFPSCRHAKRSECTVAHGAIPIFPKYRPVVVQNHNLEEWYAAGQSSVTKFTVQGVYVTLQQGVLPWRAGLKQQGRKPDY